MSEGSSSRRLRTKNWMVAIALLAFVAMVYLITLVKLTEEVG